MPVSRLNFGAPQNRPDPTPNRLWTKRQGITANGFPYSKRQRIVANNTWGLMEEAKRKRITAIDPRVSAGSIFAAVRVRDLVSAHRMFVCEFIVNRIVWK